MNENKDSKPNLRLIQGRLHCETSFKSIRIVSAPKDSPPFEVDAIALEEDTYLIMSADLEIIKPDEIATANNTMSIFFLICILSSVQNIILYYSLYISHNI